MIHIGSAMTFKDIDIKQSILNSKKYLILYLIFVAVFVISNFNLVNYAFPRVEILVVSCVAILGSFAIIFYCNNNEKEDLWKSAFIIVLIFGIMCSMLMPFFCAPDEYEHFVRSEITSTGQLVPQFENNSYQTIQAYADIQNHLGFQRDNHWNIIGVTHGTVFTSQAMDTPINYSSYSVNNSFAQNPFYGYLAQGLGMDIAKLLNLNLVWLLWLGRICNLIMYAAFAAIAVKKTPILKVPFIVMACIPLAVYQASSLSIDAFINGLSLVVIAYFFYMYKSPKRSLTRRHIVIFSRLCLLLAISKISLFLFCLLWVIVPKDNFKEDKYYYYALLSIPVVIGLVFAWTESIAKMSFHNSNRHQYWVESNVSSTGQISYLLNHKREGLVGIFHIISYINHDLLHNANRLYFNPLNSVYLMFLGAVSLLYPIKKYDLKSRIWTFLIIMGTYFGTYIMFLLAWTPVGSLSIHGVQPRYFLPLFALLPFTFGFNHMEGDKKEIDNMIILLTISFLALMIIALVGFYY